MEIGKTPAAASVVTPDLDIVQGFTKVVGQDPSHVRGGKVWLTFTPGELPGAPEALKLDDKVYAIVPKILPAGPHASQLHFNVAIPAFEKEGDYAASVRVGNNWLPLTLKVLIAAA